MKYLNFFIILTTLLFFTSFSSKYNYNYSPVNLKPEATTDRNTAIKLLIPKVISLNNHGSDFMEAYGYKKYSKFIKKDLNDSFNDFFFKQILEKDENGYLVQYVNKNIKRINQGNPGVKSLLFLINSKENNTIKTCKVKRIHKETKEEKVYYRIRFSFIVGYYIKRAEDLEPAYTLYSMNIEDEKEYKEIIDLLASIFNPEFVCDR